MTSLLASIGGRSNITVQLANSHLISCKTALIARDAINADERSVNRAGFAGGPTPERMRL